MAHFQVKVGEDPDTDVERFRRVAAAMRPGEVMAPTPIAAGAATRRSASSAPPSRSLPTTASGSISTSRVRPTTSALRRPAKRCARSERLVSRSISCITPTSERVPSLPAMGETLSASCRACLRRTGSVSPWPAEGPAHGAPARSCSVRPRFFSDAVKKMQRSPAPPDSNPVSSMTYEAGDRNGQVTRSGEYGPENAVWGL